MKFFTRKIAARRVANLTTTLERQRLTRTMPGQMGTLAALRGGYIIN